MPIATARSGSISTASDCSVSRDIRLPSRGAPQILQQRFQILVQQHALQVVRGVEPAVHLRHRGDPAHRVGQRRLDVGLLARRRLQMQQRGDDLQRIADAVVDLAQQHLALGGERGEAVARGMDFRDRLVARLADPRLLDRLVDRDVQQRHEVAHGVLHQIVGGAGFQRGDRDRGILRGGDEHHRRRVRDELDLLERLQPVEARHVLIERHHVDAALPQPGQSCFAIDGMDHENPCRCRPRVTSRPSASSSSI